MASCSLQQLPPEIMDLIVSFLSFIDPVLLADNRKARRERIRSYSSILSLCLASKHFHRMLTKHLHSDFFFFSPKPPANRGNRLVGRSLRLRRFLVRILQYPLHAASVKRVLYLSDIECLCGYNMPSRRCGHDAGSSASLAWDMRLFNRAIMGRSLMMEEGFMTRLEHGCRQAELLLLLLCCPNIDTLAIDIEATNVNRHPTWPPQRNWHPQSLFACFMDEMLSKFAISTPFTAVVGGQQVEHKKGLHKLKTVICKQLHREFTFDKMKSLFQIPSLRTMILQNVCPDHASRQNWTPLQSTVQSLTLLDATASSKKDLRPFLSQFPLLRELRISNSDGHACDALLACKDTLEILESEDLTFWCEGSSSSLSQLSRLKMIKVGVYTVLTDEMEFRNLLRLPQSIESVNIRWLNDNDPVAKMQATIGLIEFALQCPKLYPNLRTFRVTNWYEPAYPGEYDPYAEELAEAFESSGVNWSLGKSFHGTGKATKMALDHISGAMDLCRMGK